MTAGTAEKPKAAAPKAAAKTKNDAEVDAALKKAEAAKKAPTNGKPDVDAAAKALGTNVVDGIDPGPQEPYAGDELGAMSASGAPTQLSFTVGGKRPTAAGLRLTGGKLDIDGTFSKGQTIELRILAVVGEVAFVDETDAATGQVVGCERRHKARIKSVTVL